MFDTEFLKLIAERAGPGATVAVVAFYVIWRLAVSHARDVASIVESHRADMASMVETHAAAIAQMTSSFEERLEKTHVAHEARLTKIVNKYEEISTRATAALAVFNENFDRLEVRQ